MRKSRVDLGEATLDVEPKQGVFPEQITKNKTIILAKHAGFCYGVKRAVETTKKLKIENPQKDIRVLGELIHNSQVIQELEEMGIKTVNSIDACANVEGICIIRSHGISDSAYSEMQQKGFEIADLTCPDVKKVQQKAIELARSGYLLVIIGKPEHPEVVAIKANAQQYSSNVFVVQDIEAVKEIEPVIAKLQKVGVVVQTTQRIEIFKEITDYLAPLVAELKVYNTICASTSLRQREAKELAEKSDLMIVVGSKKSANTTHLAEILTDITKTIHIEDDNELENYENEIANAQKIGVTAGASTPEDIINKVLDKLNT